MRGESMKGKSKKSTYSTTFGVDPAFCAVSESRADCPRPGAKKTASREGNRKKWWPDQESNQGHKDFQSSALPTELSGQKLSFHSILNAPACQYIF